ncbi:MAG: hypothetical protein ACO1TE_13560 [Prosthecobacter sp.]
MKLYAQYGSGPGTKITEALQRGLIEGVIMGAKDESASFQREFMKKLLQAHSSARVLFDPQFYACFIATKDRARLGGLWGEDSHGYGEGGGYFRPLRRRDLEKESDAVREIERCLSYQSQLPVDALISPNIVIRRSLDSMEAAIAKTFIRLSAERRDVVAPGKPVLATLAVSSQALADRSELLAFLDDITLLDNPPDGFYLLLESQESTVPNTLAEPDMLARWMLLNRAFKVNGFEVVNGYSDLLSPYLGAAGGDAGAAGWHGTLKSFSLDRFEPLDGRKGRASARYTSTKLLKSIKWSELESVGGVFPEVWNNLPCDAFFRDLDEDSEPSLSHQALQNWESLQAMNRLLAVPGDPTAAIQACHAALNEAQATYAAINERGLTLRDKSNSQHLPAIKEEINSFVRLAELSGGDSTQ